MCGTRSGLILIVAISMFLASGVVKAVDDLLSGAIFTTDSTGSLVNGNLYSNKEDVYLSGGPGPKAPDHAAALPDGDYYFQITDPSGSVLLSSASPRMVTVSGGAFQLVQLAPFNDTPNEDGVYKVWLTPVSCYIGNTKNPGRHFGFLPKYSKTDNFRVVVEPKPQFLRVRKFRDCNANGVWDPDEKEIKDWEVHIIEPGGTAAYVKRTPVDLPAYDGDWRVLEFLPSDSCRDWVQTALIVDGRPAPVAASATVRFVGSYVSDEIHEVILGNTPLGRIGACKFYDFNGNGRWDNCEPPIPGVKFILTGNDIFAGPGDPPNVTRTLYAGPGGCVTFCGLYPGVYTLEEVAPAATPACNWQATTPTRVENIVVTCDGPDEHSYQFGNIISAGADFSSRSYWHKDGLDGIARCLDPAGDLRQQLAMQLLEFVFNVWQHLGGPAMIQLPDGGWASTSDIIAQAVAAADSTAPDAQDLQRELIALLDQLNGSDSIVYIRQEFSDCVPTAEY